jgi:hypothetical protein
MRWESVACQMLADGEGGLLSISLMRGEGESITEAPTISVRRSWSSHTRLSRRPVLDQATTSQSPSFLDNVSARYKSSFYFSLNPL